MQPADGLHTLGGSQHLTGFPRRATGWRRARTLKPRTAATWGETICFLPFSWLSHRLTAGVAGSAGEGPDLHSWGSGRQGGGLRRGNSSRCNMDAGVLISNRMTSSSGVQSQVESDTLVGGGGGGSLSVNTSTESVTLSDLMMLTRLHQQHQEQHANTGHN